MSNVTDHLNSQDIVDKYKAMKIQNRELKALLIEKDNQLNEIKKENLNYKEDISKMLDPIGQKSVLKTVKFNKFNKIYNFEFFTIFTISNIFD